MTITQRLHTAAKHLAATTHALAEHPRMTALPVPATCRSDTTLDYLKTLRRAGWTTRPGAVQPSHQPSLQRHAPVCADPVVAFQDAPPLFSPAEDLELAQEPLAPPRPPFSTVRPLGRGGQGSTTLVQDTNGRRYVAKEFTDPTAKSLQAETQANELARHCSGVARCHGQLDVGGRQCLVFDYEPGVSSLDQFMKVLREAIREGTVSGADAGQFCRFYVTRLVEAINELMQAGMTHRDLKPANVLVSSRGLPKIIDLGLATKIDAPGDAPTSGAVMHESGTTQYMPPERYKTTRSMLGAHATVLELLRKSEIYPVGQVLFHVLATVASAVKAKAGNQTEVQTPNPVYAQGRFPETPRFIFEMVCAMKKYTTGTPDAQAAVRNLWQDRVEKHMTEVGIVDAQMRSLIAAMVDLRPENRPTFNEVLAHPAMADATCPPSVRAILHAQRLADTH